MQSRRRFFRFFALSSLTLTVPLLLQCTQFPSDPVPFETGQEVPPPIGCTELRSTNRQADWG